MDDDRRCRAHSSRSGERCKKAAILAGTVCATHGGSALQVRAKADERLPALHPSAVQRLEEALGAVQRQLDRHGLVVDVGPDHAIRCGPLRRSSTERGWVQRGGSKSRIRRVSGCSSSCESWTAERLSRSRTRPMVSGSRWPCRCRPTGTNAEQLRSARPTIDDPLHRCGVARTSGPWVLLFAFDCVLNRGR